MVHGLKEKMVERTMFPKDLNLMAVGIINYFVYICTM